MVRLGLNEDGTLGVPLNPERAGWYEGSAAPGVVGPTVIAGHVTWNGEKSAFFQLGAVEPGDLVHVRREDGRTATYAVTDVEQYAKNDFPTEQVYGNVAQSELRLITCGGVYDDHTHEYEANIVAYGVLVEAA